MATTDAAYAGPGPHEHDDARNDASVDAAQKCRPSDDAANDAPDVCGAGLDVGFAFRYDAVPGNGH